MFDKWKEYKERKERQRYFRSQNDLYIDTSTWIKTILLGLVTAIIAGVAICYITNFINITSSVFYILLGYAVSTVVKTVSGVQSRQVGILAVILTIIGSAISKGFEVILFYASLGVLRLVGIAIIPVILSSIFTDIYVLLCMVVACCIAYTSAS